MTPLQSIVLKEVSVWAERFDCLKSIYLFGSVARGEEQADSDIDLCFEYYELPFPNDPDGNSYGLLLDEQEDWASALGARLSRQISCHRLYIGGLYQGCPEDAAWETVQRALPMAKHRIGKAVLVPTPRKKPAP